MSNIMISELKNEKGSNIKRLEVSSENTKEKLKNPVNCFELNLLIKKCTPSHIKGDIFSPPIPLNKFKLAQPEIKMLQEKNIFYLCKVRLDGNNLYRCLSIGIILN